jgi:16S rRNA (cytosine967-C5)-methyltransferase
MTPAARIQASVELLCRLADEGRPEGRTAAAILQDYLRQRRYIGSKDRREIGRRLFALLRAEARLTWWLDRLDRPADLPAEAAARARTIAWLRLGEGLGSAELAALFSGESYAPAPLDDREAALNAALDGQDLDDPEQPDWVRRELPDWLHDRLLRAYGEAELAALGQAASLDLRVNSLKTTPAAAAASLAEAEIATTPGRWAPLALRSDGRRAVTATKAFRDGWVEVQDEGSQLVALLSDARPGERVCDFCAGGGGKTLALAAAMQNRGRIVACDNQQGRLDQAAKRLRRAGVEIVTRRVLSGERDPWIKRHRRGFDRVLVDAPCSGSGSWRRHPEARWRLTPEALAGYGELQARLLDSAWRLVKPGGRLIYATCSLLPEENQAQAAGFLAPHPDFTPLPIGEVWSAVLGGAAPATGDWLQLTPARHGCDGFFLAVLARKAES